MKIKYFITIFATTLFQLQIEINAIEISIDNVKGASTYSVEAPSLKLKSKLNFPYEFEKLNISFSKNALNGNVDLGFSFPIYKSTRFANDYDWKNDQLTVASTSDSQLSKYYSFYLEWVSKSINRYSFSSKLLFQELDTYWTNTRQKDYVKNFLSFSPKNTLRFNQDYFLYDFGIHYQVWKASKTNIEIGTKFVIGLVEVEDIHILRDFYTLHDSKVKGYFNQIKFSYLLSNQAKVGFAYIDKYLRGDKKKMDYYFIGGSKLISYPAVYMDKRRVFTITLQKNF